MNSRKNDKNDKLTNSSGSFIVKISNKYHKHIHRAEKLYRTFPKMRCRRGWLNRKGTGNDMSESYVINEKRELILDRVKEFIYQNGGVVKKSQLNELGIDYRRILDFVEKGDLIRIKNGYYAVRLSDFSEEELIARLFPDCVLNLETALYAYGYLDRKPYGYKLSVDKNTSKSSVRTIIYLRQSIAEATREMKEHYQLTVDYDMSPEIPRNVKYCFITAVKEAMSNIAKHSDADKISVILREHPAFYQMTVEDNGTVRRKGQSGPLWEEEVVRMDGKEGIGLSNMKERVQALGGTFRIHTEKGFVIFISIPKRDKM